MTDSDENPDEFYPGNPMAKPSARWSGERFAEVIETAINETVLGDRIDWDFSPAVMPAETRAGQPVTAYLVILSCRSPLISPPRISVTDVIWDSCPSDEQIRHAVTRAVTALYEVRRDIAHGARSQGAN